MNRILGSKRLRIIAVALWITSLILPGIVFYSPFYGNDFLLGYSILLFGWSSIFSLNVAWYANVFFLLLAFQKDKGIILAIVAVIFSFHMFYFSSFMEINAVKGRDVNVYGFGIGSLLWIVAMFFILLSEIAREIEAASARTDEKITNRLKYFKHLVIVLTISFIGGSFYLGINDRIIASPEEKKKLAVAIFKHTQICSSNGPNIKKSLLLSGPIEIHKNYNGYQYSVPRYFHNLGIKIVRFEGYDYFNDRDKSKFIAVKSKGPPGARLYLNRYYDSNIKKYWYQIKLTSSDGKEVIFDQEFKWLGHSPCPSLSVFPEILRSALSIPSSPKNRDASRHYIYSFENIEANVIETKTYFGPKITHPYSVINCPSNIGFEKEAFSRNFETKGLGVPFRVNEKIFFIKNVSNNVICSDEYIYFVNSGKNRANKCKIVIDKYGVDNIEKIWAKKLTILNNKVTLGSVCTPISISETLNHIDIGLYDKRVNTVRVIRYNKVDTK